ncbi:BTB domain-containing protein [Trichostrongylus colubriformis]|uniref:BTB domain-containing protein n=1 Tax=Trichostrongylus colubriformis TaxID=6319 RepID=A0AAN8F6T6_TRICO
MGGGSSSLRVKSRSSADLDRLKPTAEQRTPKPRSRFASLAQSSSKHLSKLPFRRRGGKRSKVKSFRDLISTWPIHDVETLYRELETSRILSLLQGAADSARASVPSIGEELYSSSCKDFVLKIAGNTHRLHRRLAVTRCTVIADLVENKGITEVDLAIPAVKRFTPQDIDMFINYLYTDLWPGSADTLNSLRDCLGCNQDLLMSLRNAEEMALKDGDLTIVLTSAASNSDEPAKGHPPDYSIRCDSSIVSARSTLFRSLLNHVGDRGRIVLDETLLPRGFAPVVVHFLYTDELDFSMIPDTTISQSSLSEARAIVAGRSPHSPLHRAIQLIHIAKFFALEKLVHREFHIYPYIYTYTHVRMYLYVYMYVHQYVCLSISIHISIL